ncbi:MAG TPA: hypothetical protein VL101_14285 [Nordella sp.]|nr:hypothetical protein [Nordella sp.]
MTIVQEGLAAMRGCWRLMRRDPQADEDFNLTIDGFWRSFAMILPLLVLMYPIFISRNRFVTEGALETVVSPSLNMGRDYAYVIGLVLAWPLVAALLAKLLGVGQTYIRYMVIYNWMTLPATAVVLLPHLLHLVTGAIYPALILEEILFLLLLYVSWYVAKAGLRTSTPVAVAFVLAEYALTVGVVHLFR